MTTNIIQKYTQRIQHVNSLLCVGLDSQLERLPTRFRNQPEPQFSFNQWIIDQTHTYASAFKPNLAFYEARGDQGLRELKQTMDYLHTHHSDILTIGDAKRADIGTTNAGYVSSLFDWLGFDAVTLNPYLGQEALQPFLERDDKACIILCHTSNAGADEFQNRLVDGKPLWQIVAENVAYQWNHHDNCMLVVGATQPNTLRQVRQIVGEMTLLVPGIGAQGGDIESTVTNGINMAGQGLIINVSRSIIFADDPALAAQDLRDEFNVYR
jgi:orotidine-5'-phosphate decarboxylase